MNLPGLLDSPRDAVLVTGGAGYIGSHACKALYEAGYLPIAYDNLASGHASAVKWGPVEEGDILDRDRLNRVIRHWWPIAIMHFAAVEYVGDYQKDLWKYYSINVGGSLTLIEAALDHGIRYFVFSSSYATYGIPGRLPIREDTPQQPTRPDGQPKFIVELMLAQPGRMEELKSMILRYGCAAGADPRTHIGESHDPKTHLIPLLFDATSRRQDAVAVLGSGSSDTPGPASVREYLHVSDIADAHVKALQALERGSPSAAYNLGLGQGFSVPEVIAALEEVTGLSVSVISDRLLEEPEHLVSDATKAHEELGWEPKFKELGKIVQTAWAWHQRKKN